MMKFYDCQPAPSPRRVRIFLKEKGVEIPTVQIDLGNKEQLGDAFKAINPDCTVPVLELEDGTYLTEILAICHYVEALHPEPCLLGRDAKEQALVLMWNAKIEQLGLLALAEMFRNKTKGMSSRALTGPIDFEQIPALVERGRVRAEAFMARLNEHLSSSDFIAGDQFMLADITALVMIDFAKWSKVMIQDDWLHLQRWYDEVRIRPSANV